jgi:ornithine carbamoyltransferase
MQSLADMMVVYEHFGYLEGLKIAWVGDGNNVLHSLLVVAPKLKMNITAATPVGKY